MRVRYSSTGAVVHFLQRERDITALFLSNLGAETQMLVTDRYAETDKAILSMSAWPDSDIIGYSSYVTLKSATFS